MQGGEEVWQVQKRRLTNKKMGFIDCYKVFINILIILSVCYKTINSLDHSHKTKPITMFKMLILHLKY